MDFNKAFHPRELVYLKRVGFLWQWKMVEVVVVVVGKVTGNRKP